MQYREYQPCAALQPVIQCYWMLEGVAETVAPPHRVFPDGHMEMVFHLADPFYRLQSDGAEEKQQSMLLAGQIRTPLTLRQGRVVDVVGIRFQPGGAFAFHRFPQQEIAGVIANLECFWGARARMFRDALGEAPGGLARIRILERLLLEACPRIPEPLGSLSPRQYRRRFEEAVGVPPKLFARIRRFQRALNELGVRPIAQVAADCGYYDQPHLIRDFREFAGVTPAGWLRTQQNVLFFQDAAAAEILI